MDISNMGIEKSLKSSALKIQMKGKKHVDHLPSDNCQWSNTHFQNGVSAES